MLQNVIFMFKICTFYQFFCDFYPEIAFFKTKISVFGQKCVFSCSQNFLVNGDPNGLLPEWLQHLSYLVDARTLFSKALKTYDLHIALMVAEACGHVRFLF